MKGKRGNNSMPNWLTEVEIGDLHRAALQQRRIAIGAWRCADSEALKDEPWTDRNVRLWGGVAFEAERKRAAIIRGYLDRRKAR